MSIMPITRTDHFFKLANGKTVSLNYWHCLDADLSIITSKKIQCDSLNQVITNSEIIEYKQVMLYCSSAKTCRVKFGKKKSC